MEKSDSTVAVCDKGQARPLANSIRLSNLVPKDGIGQDASNVASAGNASTAVLSSYFCESPYKKNPLIRPSPTAKIRPFGVLIRKGRIETTLLLLLVLVVRYLNTTSWFYLSPKNEIQQFCRRRSQDIFVRGIHNCYHMYCDHAISRPPLSIVSEENFHHVLHFVD